MGACSWNNESGGACLRLNNEPGEVRPSSNGGLYGGTRGRTKCRGECARGEVAMSISENGQWKPKWCKDCG